MFIGGNYMKFKMNSIEYEIVEVTQKEYKDFRTKENEELEYKKEDMSEGVYYGATHTFKDKIYLEKGLPLDRKKRTLIHELTHCFIGEFITHESKQYDEEMVADISANCHDIIHKIVEDYFKEK